MSEVILTTKDKANKKTAFTLLLELKQTGNLSEYNLDRLLNYFAPPIPKKPKTVLEWVALAAATSDIREFLNYIHIKDGWPYASDGHRLHAGNRVEVEDGVYDPKTLLRVDMPNEYTKFQKIEEGCPTYDDPRWRKTKISSLSDKYVNSATKVTFGWPDVDPDMSFSARYILDVVGDSNIVEHAYVGKGKIFIQSAFGTAVIMGIRQNQRRKI